MKAGRAAVVSDHRLTSKARTALAQSSAESTHPHRHSPAMCRRVHQVAAVGSVDGGKTSVLHSPRAMHAVKLRLDLTLSIEFWISNPSHQTIPRVAESWPSAYREDLHDACVHPHTHTCIHASSRESPPPNQRDDHGLSECMIRLRGIVEVDDSARQNPHCG